MLEVKGLVIATSIVAAATVAWMCQTPDALMRVDSFGGAVAQVAFWGAPTYLLYLALVRARDAVLGVGVVLVALFAAGWASYAADGHSTAALGPAFSGWLFGPAIVIGVALIERAGARGRRREP